MAKDMFERLLESLVDYVFAKTGQTKETIQKGVTDFLSFGAYAHGALQRIEHNQRLLIEAENERRDRDGQPRLAGLYNGSGPNGTRNVTGRSDSA